MMSGRVDDKTTPAARNGLQIQTRLKEMMRANIQMISQQYARGDWRIKAE